ncbi:MAG TPA: histidine phosphatase family protein [Actinomycetota bacterium]|nr:histidine phosphatase family protein [Actinomycetota bacterium]
MNTIHLVRHGRVENPAGVIYGRLPGFNLSDLGRLQAEAAAERLSSRDVGAIWSSPLERAQETAQAIAAPHGLDIVTDDRLIESGTTLEGIGRSVMAFARSPRALWGLRNPWRPSWGESFKEIRDRMVPAISEAIASVPGREVVIVSHQTPVIVARLSLARSRVPPWMGFTPCATGSVTTLAIEDEKVVSASYFAPVVNP